MGVLRKLLTELGEFLFKNGDDFWYWFHPIRISIRNNWEIILCIIGGLLIICFLYNSLHKKK